MHWLKIIILTFAGLLASTVLLLVSAVVFIGHGDLGGIITRGVDTFTGHSIEFDGPVTLELSMHPSLKVAGVRFRMQQQSVELQSDDLRLQLDIPALADGHVHVLDIGARNTVVTVRLSADKLPDEAETDLDLKALTFDRIDIENLTVDIYQPHEIEPLHIKVDIAQAVRNELGVLSPATVRGSVDGEPISLDGSVARGEADTAAGRPYIVDARFEVLQSSIHASGELAGAADAAVTGELAVQLDIQDVQAVLQLFHIGMPPVGALSATGNLSGRLDALRLSNLDARLTKEGVHVTTTGTVANLNAGTGFELEYTTDITDAGLLAWLIPDEVPEFNSVQSDWRISGDMDRLALVAERLEATDARGHRLDVSGKVTVLDAKPFLDELQASVKLSAPNLDYVRQFSNAVPRLGPVQATANITMNDGVMAIHDIKFTSTAGSKGRVHAVGSIGHISFSPVNVSQRDLSVRVEHVTAKQIGDELGLDLPAVGPVNAAAIYRGSDEESVLSNIKLQAGHREKLLLDASGEIHLGDMKGDKLLTDITLDIVMQAPSSAELGVLTGGNLPALGVFRGDVKIRKVKGLIGIPALDASIRRGDEFNLKLAGSLDDLHKVAGINMKLDMNAADLATIGKSFDVKLPREGAIRTAGIIRGNRKQLRYTGRTNLRNTTLTTDLTGSFTGKRPRIAGTIQVPVLDIHDVGLHPERRARQAQQAQQADPEETTTAASEEPKETVPLFSNEPIDVAWLRAVDLDVKVSIDRLASTAASIEMIFARVLLNDGKLDVTPLRYSVDGDVITNALTINAKPDIPTVSLELGGNDIDLGLLLTNSPEQPAPIRGIMTADADLHTRGQTQAQMAANLSGTIHVLAENAKIKKSYLSLLQTDVFGWVLSNTVSLKKDMNIGCAIFSMTFNKGVGDTDMFIIDTPETLVKIDAAVDFRDETMYVAILPERKRKLLGSRDPMEIQGPITNPEYKLVSLKNLTMESSRAWLLAPITITETVLGNLATLVGAERESVGTCDQFISQ